MSLHDKTILVTGATGYIGGRLAERLVQERGATVRVLARTPGKAAWLARVGCEIVVGDLTEPASLRRAVAGCAVVYHAGAWVSERGAREEVWAVNVLGTQHLVEAAAAAGVERFVQVSSCAVYGSRQEFNIDETTPPRTGSSLYADTKIAAEEVVWRAWRKQSFPIVVARPAQVYGLGSPQFTLRPIRMIQQGTLVLVDGGRHLCKPLYIDNLVDGLLCCGEHPAAVGEAFNFADGAPVPWRDFFGAYAAMVGVKRLPSVPYPLAWLGAYLFEVQARVRGKPEQLNRRVVRTMRSNNSFSIRKAEQILGWQPRIDLAEGMRRTEAWLRTHGYLSQL
jgi:2-alkyl-3-oxoalkanoate reductase